jgi:hypothetical protein
MYSGPSCFSSLLERVAISWAVYSETRGLSSSKGLDIVFPPELRCCSPGLRKVSDYMQRERECRRTQAFCLCV